MQPVELDVRERVACIRFGAPLERNLLTVPLLKAFPDALRRAVEDDARVIVLRGHGQTWSAGYDVEQIPPEIFADDPDTVAAHPFESCMAAVRECPLPLVAALEGVVFGGALELAASCDLALASASTRFGLTPARLGLIYSHTGLRTLLGRIGSAHLRMLVFTGHSIDAREAERMGLVNEVVDAAHFDARVAEVARQIAHCAPLSVQGMKRVLGILEGAGGPTQAEVRDILALRKHAYESADFREGQRAFREKRPPDFRGH